MKFFKQLITLSMLLGTVVSFAAQQNPCVDSFCDKPSTSCCKKIVKADKLFVRGDAKVCGDLTVRGEIHNLELDLLRDTAVPPTDEIYNQFDQFPFAQPILEVIEDFSIPRDLIVPGTEIDPAAPIYGYNKDQTLDKTGGPEKSYNTDFNAVNMRYHGENPANLTYCLPENMKSWYEHTLSYYIQRGFPMPGIDVYPQFDGQFVFSNNLNGIANFVAIKFVFEDGPMPVALDLVATAATSTFVALSLFEADESLRENGFYYPVRIPITTDFTEFNNKFNKQSIVFFDNLNRTITIHVPECNNNPVELSRFQLSIPCCNCNVDIDYTDNLVAFDGTFNLMRRNAQNQLVSSSFADLQYLIQASQLVSVKTEFIDHNAPSILTFDYNFSEAGGVFTGLAIPLMNGGNSNFDVYTFNLGFPTAFSQNGDPLILPSLQNDESTLFAAGDNPTTVLVEHLGSPVYNGIFDSELFNFALPELPSFVMNGQTTPEENANVPLPEFFVTPTKILNQVVGHTFLFNAETLSGTVNFLPQEGHAVGIEMDPKLSSNAFPVIRNINWAGQYLPAVVRGNWPLTAPEFNAPASTEGSSIFWRYIATQFDYNNQVMRRMSDILSHETLNPLLEENGVPFFLVQLLSGTLGLNPAGGLLALAQALQELHNKNIQDVFSDYAISLAMLRNNASLNDEYKHAFPYWLLSPSYAGNQDLASFNPQYATWWQDYQDNRSPDGVQLSTSPAIPGSPFVACYTTKGPRLTTSISAQGAIVQPNPPGDACTTVTNDLDNKIGIVLRSGACGSGTFVLNTEAAGNPIAATLIIDNGAGICNYGGSPSQQQVAAAISQEDGAALLQALDVNPTLTLILEPAPFVPVLDQDVINRETQDMTLLIFEVPEFVNTVTVDVGEGDWRLSVLQFTSTGTPNTQGVFIIDGPHPLTSGGQRVFDMSQFPRTPESGSVRLVAANVGIHDYVGLNNFCGAEPIITGRITILPS